MSADSIKVLLGNEEQLQVTKQRHHLKKYFLELTCFS